MNLAIRRPGQGLMERLRIVNNLVWNSHEDDPTRHTMKHEGLFYRIPNDPKDLLQLFGQTIPFKPKVNEFHKVINQIPVMIRQPALKTMDYIRSLSEKENFPTVRVVLYGEIGNGTNHSLNHLLHFLKLYDKHIILHFKDIRKFTRSPHGITPSTSRPGRMDTPVNAANVLGQFRVQNSKLLESLKDVLVSSQDYKWSVREITKAGDPLYTIAEHGVSRQIHASDCLAVLIKELMLAADAGKIKLATVMNYTNFLFTDEAGVLKHPDKKKLYVDEITVARAITKLIKNQYKNGVVVADCFNVLSDKPNQTPREVFGVDAWNYFDPCLPIYVPRYSRKEFESCMNFYQDIGWLCRPESKTEEVREELRFLSGMSPQELFNLCRSI